MFEVMVSLVVLLLLIALLGQIIGYANLALSSSSKQFECASQARIALDRLGLNLSSRVKNGGATIIVNKVAGASDGICFLAYSRTSNLITTNPQSGQPSTPRVGVFGFAEQVVADSALGNAQVPMLTWGNGVVAWGAQASATNYVDSDPFNALRRAASDLPTSYQAAATSNDMLEWVPLGIGVVRFEVSFLLDNGSVTTVPPNSDNGAYSQLVPPLYPLALSASSSADPNHRYVTALIVGIAVLDTQTRKLLLSHSGFQNLNSALPDVANSPAGNLTPLEVWTPMPAQWVAGNTFPKPVIQALRFYQRTFFL